MRQLIVGQLHSRLLQQIQKLPDVRAAVNAGSATFEHYAAAIIATIDPSAVLQSHHEASRPKRRSGERLVDAVLRAELALRTAAAHGCQPAAVGRFWAVFGLLTPLSSPPIRAAQECWLSFAAHSGGGGHESEGAATTRFSNLVTWAKAQYITAPAGQQQRPPLTGGRRSSPTSQRVRPAPTPVCRTQGSPPHAAAAEAPSLGQPTPLSPDPALTMRTTPSLSTRLPLAPLPAPAPLPWRTGIRASGRPTQPKRRGLQCPPSRPINAWPCPVHANRGQQTNAPRCIPTPSDSLGRSSARWARPLTPAKNRVHVPHEDRRHAVQAEGADRNSYWPPGTRKEVLNWSSSRIRNCM